MTQPSTRTGQELLRLRLEREDAAIRRSIHHFRSQGRNVLFPEARRLADVMESAIPRQYLLRQATRVVHTWRLDSGGVATLSSYCGVAKADNLDVVPKPELVKRLGETLMLSNRYSIYSKIVAHDNGVAVLYAEYDQIIGSRIVAVVHSRSVPGLE